MKFKNSLIFLLLLNVFFTYSQNTNYTLVEKLNKNLSDCKAFEVKKLKIPSKKYEYLEIENQVRVVGLDSFADEKAVVNKEFPQSKWELSFNDLNTHTVVETKMSFADLAQLETTIQMGFKEGYTIAMEGLDELLHSF